MRFNNEQVITLLLLLLFYYEKYLGCIKSDMKLLQYVYLTIDDNYT